MLGGYASRYTMAKRDYIKNNVQALRAARSITQEELAQAVGVTRQTIISIEKGNYDPSALLALKIAREFKVPLEEVFYISYEK